MQTFRQATASSLKCLPSRPQEPSSGAANFGDCFAYALAKAMGEPLLYKGNDFTHTDVTSAI